MGRNVFSIRRRVTVSQKLPEDVIPKLTEFVMYIRKLQLKNQYAPAAIFACDETAVSTCCQRRLWKDQREGSSKNFRPRKDACYCRTVGKG